MQRLTNWQQLRVHPIFPQVYLETARNRGADPIGLLQRAGLKPGRDTFDDLDLNMAQMNSLVNAVIEATGNHGIGIEVGQSIPPTAFGSLGFAIVCSETIYEAIKTAQRFWNLAAQHLSVDVTMGSSVCEITVRSLIDLEDPFQQLILESAIAVFKRALELLSLTPSHETEVWFCADEPPYVDLCRQRLGKVRYNMSGNCFRFNSGVLTTKLPMRNPSGLKLAWAQCENEEAQLDWPDQPLLERIRNALEPGPGGYPGLEEISRRMGLSPRTLRRHLEADHSSFATLLETRKHQDAIRLLNDPELSIQDISTRLGYLDPANFTRAFRQWTGETPTQYRQRGKSLR